MENRWGFYVNFSQHLSGVIVSPNNAMVLFYVFVFCFVFILSRWLTWGLKSQFYFDSSDWESIGQTDHLYFKSWWWWRCPTMLLLLSSMVGKLIVQHKYMFLLKFGLDGWYLSFSNFNIWIKKSINVFQCCQ